MRASALQKLLYGPEAPTRAADPELEASFSLGERYFASARSLGRPEDARASWMLLGDAANEFMRILVADEADENREDWATIAENARVHVTDFTRPILAQLSDPAALDLAPEQAANRLPLALALVSELRRTARAKCRPAWLHRRRSRNVLVAIVALLLVSIAAVEAFTPTNLASEHRVQASSLDPRSLPPNSLTNDVVEPAGAAFTQNEPNSWFAVDLGRSRTIRRVDIYGGRASSGSLFFEVSDDGEHYVLIDRTTHAPSQTLPWRIRIPLNGRYLRVRSEAAGALRLSEIQAY